VLPITEAVSIRAMTYVEEHFLSGSLQLADALIAATCIEQGERLVTGNLKHYRMIPELAIEPFQIEISMIQDSPADPDPTLR